ncbi:hypothetical protein FNV43_RR12966 [Rhamnella rubrinervis]|uniref:Pentatricopeptide repeat-containing protein n=1 Tax=Rhamnella rubrinervis TaxID=2594499 RepID=A0A8K0MDC8_9ROSA|nr:hypothetical protein FNV43_RR12966 [Rhamnella rubrinervis]
MLNRLLRERQFAPANHVVILMIKACRNEEDLKRVIVYLNEISKKGFEFTLYSFNTLLIQLGKFEMVSVAQNVYTQMLNSGIRPSLLTFNTMINIFCKKGKVQEAKLIFSKIYQFDMCPDTFTYTPLILGHCRNCDLDLAFEVFDRMKSGCDPNAVTYLTLINGLCNDGRVDDALDMLEEMIEKGIEPTVYTYTVPITSLCGVGRVLDAVELFGSMKKRGCNPNDGFIPNTVTFNALINELCVERRLNTALKIFHWLEGHGALVNSQTCNEIKGLCSIGDISKAMVLFDKMLKAGPSPTVITYNLLIDGYVKLEWGISPNQVSYTALINGYCMEGKLDVALSLFEKMVGSDCCPSTEMYNAIINGFSKDNQFSEADKTDLAFKIFNEMADDAEKLLEEIEREGLVPDEVTFTCLINGFVMIGKLDHAFSLIRRMVHIGCQPNHRTYCTLLKGLQKEFQQLTVKVVAQHEAVYTCNSEERYTNFELLCNLLARMSASDCEPTVDTYGTLVKGLCREVSSAMKIFDLMVVRGFEPQLPEYKALICALCGASQVEAAQTMFDSMLENNGMLMRLFGQC